MQAKGCSHKKWYTSAYGNITRWKLKDRFINMTSTFENFTLQVNQLVVNVKTLQIHADVRNIYK